MIQVGKGNRRLKKRLRHENRSHYSKRRYGKRNHHHIQPKSRGGNSKPSNILLIDIEKHRCWHRMFGLRNISEVIELLLRLRRFKQGQDYQKIPRSEKGGKE